MLGGGVLLVLLVLLWLVVLIPSWARSREQRVAEQHAAQIQRTVRMLAETAELPEEHIVEATAKEAFRHQKLLKAAREREVSAQKHEREKLRAEQRLTAYEQKKEIAVHKAELRNAKLSDPRLKPVRLTAALAAVFGLIGLLVGAGMALGGLGLLTLFISLGASLVGVSTLFVLAPGKRTPQKATAPSPAASTPHRVFVDPQPEVETPDTSHAQYVAQQARAAEQRERARAMSRARQHTQPSTARVNLTDSILLREERQVASTQNPPVGAAEPTPAPTPTPHPQLDVQAKSRRLAAQERLRSMGVVGDTSDGATTLEEALRKRRNAG